MNLLALEALEVRYGTHPVLDGVSLALAPGEVVALVGRSGSGKSTLAQAIAGLLPPAAVVTGRALLDDIELTRLDPRGWRTVHGRAIGMVFQDPAGALNPAQTIGAQIAEAITAHRRPGRRALRAAVADLCARVGLEQPPSRYPHQLSGGQRQRVAIAIAIAAGPRLLIADEPTAALDPPARAGVVRLLVRLAREAGAGLLLISHDLAEAARVADRLAVLEGGRLVEEGPAAACLAAPRSDALRALVAAERATTPAPPPAETGVPLLEVDDVTYLHPRARADGATAGIVHATLAVRPGETVAVVGASGSGKSTLARLALGLVPPAAGAVRIAGTDWRHSRGAAARALRRRVQAVFQDPATSFDPRYSVGRIVAEPLALLSDEAPAAARVATLLARMGLPEDAAARPWQDFSGGQRQRIALARALACAPDLVVLDEAVSALDADVRTGIVALLGELQRTRRTAFLFITHDIALAGRLAHRIVVMDRGRIVEQGPPAQILAAPRHPATARLVAPLGAV